MENIINNKMLSIFGKKTTLSSALLLLFILFYSTSNSQIVINEFSCSNRNTIQDNYNNNEDWVELYNAGTATVDLTGYHLSDKSSNPTKWQFPAVSIDANDHLIIFASSRDEFTGGILHTNFKITQNKQEYIVFSDPSGNVLDELQILNPTQKDHSRGRSIDGGSTWSVYTTPTPGDINTNPKGEYATTPIFNQDAGYHNFPTDVSLASPDVDVEIRYTLTGEEPTQTSTLYTSPISIATTTVVRTKAFSTNSNIPSSFTETNTYFIGDDYHTIKIVSICGDQVDNLLNGSSGLHPDGVFELFDEYGLLLDESSGEFNKHGNDSWAYSQRGFDYITRDQYGINHVINHKIFRTKDRTKFQRLILKPAANDNYPAEDGAHIRDAYVHALSQLGKLKLDERSHEPCVLYLNGDYWGVYEIREKVDDHDFTDYYYDQDRWDLQFLKTWGGTWSEYGGNQAQTDWDNLRSFILGNDMTIEANFDTVSKYFNWKSLIDYIVLNSYVVCSDWLNWNTAWWRGLDPDGDKKKWRYALWDMDATFGHYINYTGVPNTTPSADPCDPESLNDPGGQGHIPILNQLSNNETFVQYYQSRFIDLTNTVFSCDNMHYLLDSLIEMIEPEMQRQIDRWGGTYAGWESNVQELKDFIDDKCALFASGMIDCYNLTGPYDVTFIVEPEDYGDISINSLDLSDHGYPFTGSYFGNINTLLSAEPNSIYEFDYWELDSNTTIPGNSIADIIIDFIAGDTIIAHFKDPYPYVYLGEDTTICIGQSLALDAQNPGNSYLWNDGSNSKIFVVQEEGTYYVQVNNGLFTASDTIIVKYLSSPEVDLGEDKTICPGETFLLDVTFDQAEYLWQDNSINPTYTISDTGNYSVTITNICGLISDDINVDEGTFPQINIGDDRSFVPGEILVLDASYPNSTYLWQDNSTEPTFIVTKSGYYWVEVTNFCGEITDAIKLDFNMDADFPTAFSPNEDGLNDIFLIENSTIDPDNFQMIIYERWGGKIFETTDMNEGWDGKLKNSEKAKSGTYIYILKYKDAEGTEQFVHGNVTVIR
ncbi:MAG: T9SS type B sorting domain-containing protein [Bacteroidetes bacterium]|nr:T9SS type B sorting domain-containing protein [Bacteroidota bacterium]